MSDNPETVTEVISAADVASFESVLHPVQSDPGDEHKEAPSEETTENK